MPRLGLGLAMPSARGHATRGAEQSPGFTGSNWTLTLNGGAAGTVTQDATGVTFSGANNLAAASVAPVGGFVDNATYELTYTVSGLTLGNLRALLYGATNNHLGTGTTRSANGTYTELLTLNGATTAFLNQIRFQATGASPNNTYKISAVSVRQVIG